MPTKKTTTAVPPKPTAPERQLPLDPSRLSRTHELIIDAVTTMLTMGGHRDDVEGLLTAAMAHTRRRTFVKGVGLEDDDEKVAEVIADFVNSDFDDWKQDLVFAWRKNKRNDPPAFEPKTITDRIRANVREELTDQFEKFMGTASPEEQRFLAEVLVDYESRHSAAEVGEHELYLGMAFEYQLGQPRAHVRVPERLLDKVQKYVDALLAVEDRAA